MPSAAGEPDAPQIEALRRRGLRHLDAGEYELAVQAHDDLIVAAEALHADEPWLIETERQRVKMVARVATAGPDVREKFAEGRRRLVEGNALWEKLRYEEAEKVLDAAVRTLDEALGNDPSGLAARVVRGRCLLFLGRHEEAAVVAGEAVRRAKELYGDMHPEVGVSLLDLAFAQLGTGNSDEAFDSMRRGVATLTATAGKNKAVVSRAWIAAARFFTESGNHPGAIQAATRAVDAVEGATDDESLLAHALAKAQLGYAYLGQGNRVLAQRHLTEARDEAEGHPEIPGLEKVAAALRAELEAQARRRSAIAVPPSPPEADDPFGDVRSQPADAVHEDADDAASRQEPSFTAEPRAAK